MDLPGHGASMCIVPVGDMSLVSENSVKEESNNDSMRMGLRVTDRIS